MLPALAAVFGVCVVIVVSGVSGVDASLHAASMSTRRSMQLYTVCESTGPVPIHWAPYPPVSDTSTKHPQASAECAHHNSTSSNTKTANK